MGHPVVGDAVYGNPRQVNPVGDPCMHSALKSMKRQALHAARLGFSHPRTRKYIEFSSSLPGDMERLLLYLEGQTRASDKERR